MRRHVESLLLTIWYVAGKQADKQGGALKKDGAVGKEFTKEGSIGTHCLCVFCGPLVPTLQYGSLILH